MGKSVFPYPGGKSKYADLIINLLPEHTAYIEPFGGAAGVLFTKPESRVEVYNDIDSDIVHFFSVLRDQSDDLIEWLEAVPYSRELHEEWREEFYHDQYRPDDDVERAGRFFFLRYAQFSARYDRPVSMHTSTAAQGGTNVAKKFSNKRNILDEFARRLDGVVIENRSYKDVVDRYDDEDTVFYFDPPYYNAQDTYYRHEEYTSEFDHEEFVNVLSEIDGKWIISYNEIPPAFDDIEYLEVSEVQRHSIGSGGKGDGDKDRKERVLMNYDPDNVPSFRESTQTGLTEF